jgi:hypothetical protein
MAVKKKMNVIFKNEDEYQKYKSGQTHSDKGLRTEDGKLSSLPDIEEIKEEEIIFAPVKEDSEPGFGEKMLYAILEGLYEGVQDVLSDEQNRKAIAALASNWWNGKALPGIKKKWDDVKSVVHSAKSGETKAEHINLERIKKNTSIETVGTQKIDDKKEKSFQKNKKKISTEEYQEQVDQIKVLAILLADRIRRLSNSCVDLNNMSDEDYMLRQKEIKELTTNEVMGSIKLLVEKEGFALDEPTEKMFHEFIAGNLIVNGELVPIDRVKNSKLLKEIDHN